MRLSPIPIVAGLSFLFATILLTTPPELGVLEGTISDSKGPVRGALVEARNERSRGATSTRSDTSGHYEIKELTPGRYSLWIQAPAHEWVLIPRLLVESGKSTRHDIYLDALVPTIQKPDLPGTADHREPPAEKVAR